MMDNNTDGKAAGPNILMRAWTFLRRPSAKYSVLTIGAVSVLVVGIIVLGGFNSALEATNKLEFCIGCHEMRDTVFQEYKKSIHYANRTGVRAECPDCHVPKDFTGKMIRKVKAAGEIWGALTDSIHTQEKFDARRIVLATNEWNRMKASGSQECRNCHKFEAMSGVVQKQTVFKKHMQAKVDGQTCIDCHKGIAHALPKEYVDPEEEL